MGLRGVLDCVMAAIHRKASNTKSSFVQQYMTNLWKHSAACAYGTNDWSDAAGGKN